MPIARLPTMSKARFANRAGKDERGGATSKAGSSPSIVLLGRLPTMSKNLGMIVTLTQCASQARKTGMSSWSRRGEKATTMRSTA